VGEKKASADDAQSRLSELKDRVERATKLIAELREANYSLTGEIAELHRKLGALPASVPPARSAPSEPSEEVHEELQLLRDERKIIRAKVQNLLERIGRIDL
jgi:predicted  nucleic acid-binding Zn-ribbon protein